MFVSFRPNKTTVCCACKQSIIDCTWNTYLKAYICPNCSSKKRYSAKNDLIKGTKQKRLPLFSLEFEVQEPPCNIDSEYPEPEQIEAAQQLLLHQFVRTQDTSVGEEYKSPIYCSLRSFYPSLDAMHDLRHLVGQDCGTHIHVECQVKDLLVLYMGEVFGPLTTQMLEHPQQTFIFWGRWFNRYAEPYAQGRNQIFNLNTNHPTLEYRLPRFRDKMQYLAVAKFARACTALLDKEMPLVKEQPQRLTDIGQDVLRLYQSYLETQSTWLDILSEEQKQEFTFPVWRVHL